MRYLLVAALICTPAVARADKAQPWPTLFVSAPLGGKWSGSLEVINRVATDDDPSQLETRFQIGRKLSKKVTLWAGYVRTITYQPLARTGIENQAVEQLNWDIGAVGPVKLASRTRLEQRFLRGNDGLAWRLREQVRASVPIDDKGTSFVVWTEPFVSLNTTPATAQTFDQVRTFIGVDLPVARHADVEIGYLQQHQHRQPADIDIDVVPIVLSLRF